MSAFSLPGKALFALVCLYLSLATAFGESFYKLSVAGITASEIICLLFYTLFAVMLASAASRTIIGRVITGKALFVFVYWLSAVAISLIFFDREGYFILRQSSHLFYFFTSFAIAAVLIVTGIDRQRSLGLVAITLVIVSLLISIFFNSSNRDASLPFLLLALLLCRDQYRIPVIAASVLFFVLSGHGSYRLCILTYFAVVVLMRYKALIPYAICVGAISVALLLPVVLSVAELRDVNAVWRYYYWHDMLAYLFDNFRFLHGIGYGEPYLQPAYENFGQLTSQVDSGMGVLHQMYVVPPHNSFLTLFYHLGLFPLIAFIGIFVRLFLNGYRCDWPYTPAALIAIALLMSTHNAVELPYMSLGVAACLGVIMARCFEWQSWPVVQEEGGRWRSLLPTSHLAGLRPRYR